MPIRNKYRLRTVAEEAEELKAIHPNWLYDEYEPYVLNLREKRVKHCLKKFPAMYQDANILDFGSMGEHIAKLVNSLFQGAEEGDERFPKSGLILSGPVGTGKTHAFYAILRFILETDPERLSSFHVYPELMQTLKAEFANGAYDDLMSSTWLKYYCGGGVYGGLVAIDDVLSGKTTDFELDKLFMILDKRTSNMEPTILTTNVAPDNFKEAFGERVASRLNYFHQVSLLEEDMRKAFNTKENA